MVRVSIHFQNLPKDVSSNMSWSEWPTRLSTYINTLYTIHLKESKKQIQPTAKITFRSCLCCPLLSFPKAPKQKRRNPTAWTETTNRPSGAENIQETFFYHVLEKQFRLSTASSNKETKKNNQLLKWACAHRTTVCCWCVQASSAPLPSGGWRVIK